MPGTLKYLTLALGLSGLALTTSLAQVRPASKLPGKRPASIAAQAANHQTKTPGTPSYTYTPLSYPGTLTTLAIGINPGALTSKLATVGETGQDGFVALMSGNSEDQGLARMGSKAWSKAAAPW